MGVSVDTHELWESIFSFYHLSPTSDLSTKCLHWLSNPPAQITNSLNLNRSGFTFEFSSTGLYSYPKCKHIQANQSKRFKIIDAKI